MSIKFTCDDKSTLVSYLYGEIDQDTRQAVDAHLATCLECASEVTALCDVRSELGLWVPPEVELDFTIVKKSELPAANVLRPARWWNTVPVWAQAAAAILVLAAGASIANLQVRSGPDGLSVSTGWMAPQAPALSGVSGRESVAGDVEGWKPALVALETQLRNEMRSTRQQEARVAAPAPVDDATIRRVQQLIAESEQRHERELAARFIDFTRDINMQRRADLMNIGRGMVNYEDQLQRQRQMINNVIRVSGTPQQ
jgi:anti-sigma factor RsiW